MNISVSPLWCLFLLFVRLLTCQPHLVDSACQLSRCLSSHHQAFLDSSFLGFSLHLLWKMVMRWRPDYTPYQLWESWGTQLLCSDEPKKGCMFKAKAADMEPLTHYSKRKGRLVPTCFWMCWNFTSTLRLVLAFKSADGILWMMRKQRYNEIGSFAFHWQEVSMRWHISFQKTTCLPGDRVICSTSKEPTTSLNLPEQTTWDQDADGLKRGPFQSFPSSVLKI